MIEFRPAGDIKNQYESQNKKNDYGEKSRDDQENSLFCSAHGRSPPSAIQSCFARKRDNYSIAHGFGIVNIYSSKKRGEICDAYVFTFRE